MRKESLFFILHYIVWTPDNRLQDKEKLVCRIAEFELKTILKSHHLLGLVDLICLFMKLIFGMHTVLNVLIAS